MVNKVRVMESVSDIDWSTWTPTESSALLFVIRGGQILLIRKKRGLGAGKINGPGGRLDPGETPLQAAVRETREEVGVAALGVREWGELRFQFTDGYKLLCHVFAADGCEGEAIETDEALPLWTSLHEIPYDEMWADDRLWLPLMLAGRRFSLVSIFDGDRLVDVKIDAHDPADSLFRYLKELGIETETVAHPPVFTVEAAKAHRVNHDGLHVKNLFLRNKKGAMWLVSVQEDRVIDLRGLGERLGAGNLSFCSAERLRKHLGVQPGSVTPLAILHDRDHQVKVAIDASLVGNHGHKVLCHPMTNDRTTAIRDEDLIRFLVSTGHQPVVLNF
ncbi:NUDIX domain-containing protein [Pendulispora rubella]|uniref:Oxidized purine nucleoside triphosphate hydrolase n=1 Tax=Pendulispora rubella TaxID=2741070 RepID=A0ABZ2LG69_9BACT